MNLGAYDITIDFSKLFVHNNTSIYFKEGDLNTAKVRAKLTMQRKVIDITGCNIVVKIETMTGGKITDTATIIDATNGIIEIDFKSNSLIEGTNFFELKIVKGESVKESPKLAYRVLDSIEDAGSIEGANEYPILVQLIRDVNKAIDNADKALNIATDMQSDLDITINKANTAIANAQDATSNANSKINELDVAKSEMVEKVDKAINNMQSTVETAKNEMEVTTAETIANINRAIAAGTQDLEVKEARKDANGVVHDTLKERLESDLVKGKLIEETKEGNYLTFGDTVGSLVSYLEVFGNAVQDVNRLQDIRSVGIDNGDGTFKMSILSCGENLFNGKWQHNTSIDAQGQLVQTTNRSTTADYIKVSSNEKITCCSDRGRLNNVYCFDEKFKYLGITNYNATTVTTLPNTHYIKVNIVTDTVNYDKFAVYKGEHETVYTPYEETRCDINLPCQLEKWDRLYFDKDENAWCVDKVTVEGVLDGTQSFIDNHEMTLCKAYFTKDLPNIKPSVTPYIAKFKQLKGYDVDERGTFSSASSAVYITMEKSVVGNATELKEWFKNNPCKILYPTTKPQKIVLPKDVQIKLNSFANKTHIFILSGEVDATVKATVNKSLASTVQANSNELNILSNRIADIEGLKESQDFSHETDKGYLVCKDTKSGVVKDMKLYGKSLVNRANLNVREGSSGIYYDSNIITTPGEYTVVNETSKRIIVGIYSIDTDTWSREVKVTGKSLIVLNENEKIRQIIGKTSDGWSSSDIEVLNKTMILEGDHTQNPPGYFEGIASVGTGTDKIEVSSRNENLFDNEKDFVKEFETKHTYDGKDLVIEGNWYVKYNLDYIPKNTDFVICANIKGDDISQAYINVYYSDGSTLPSSVEIKNNGYAKYNSKNGVSAVNIYCSGGTKKTVTYENFGVYLSSGKQEFVNPKQDTKSLLYKDTDNTWKPIEELRGIWKDDKPKCCDVIEGMIDGSHKLKLRLSTSIFKGTEACRDVTASDELSGTDLYMVFRIPEYIAKNYNSPSLCNKFPTVPFGDFKVTNFECVSVDNYGTTVKILKSRLSSQDTDGFKTLLKQWHDEETPLEVICERPQEEVYEVAPMDLESFENETMISFGSGVIAPYASWKITSYLPNFVRNLAKQVKQLQGQVYKTNLANFTVALNTLETKLRLEQLTKTPR